MAVNSVNPYANAHTSGEMRKVSDNMMKDFTNTAGKKEKTQATPDYNVNISNTAKQKAQANPYANAHSAAEIRKVSDNLMKNYTKGNAAQKLK